MEGAKPRQSFPRARRLILPREFLRVKLEGKADRGAHLVLGVLKVGESEPRFRAGFVTSKRLGGAVVRNRVRRRLREIVRKHQGAVTPGVWMVLIARSSAANATFAALEDDWLRLANRASILAP